MPMPTTCSSAASGEKIPVTHAFAYLTFVKGGKVQHLLHQLKYRNQPEVGKLLGRWYGADLQAAGFENKFDLIVPVPLHPAKFRKRGYNQSDAIAEGLSEGMGIAWSDKTVIRTIFTDTQTHKKRYARYQNVASVFAVAEPEKIQGRHILVVDDVMTTGSTFEACANTILQNGASAISVLALAAAK